MNVADLQLFWKELITGTLFILFYRHFFRHEKRGDTLDLIEGYDVWASRLRRRQGVDINIYWEFGKGDGMSSLQRGLGVEWRRCSDLIIL